jgi:hypothetical protein
MNASALSVAEIRDHLCELQRERLEAESAGLTGNALYMADLATEQAEYQDALVAAAIGEILSLRSELGRRQYG